MIPMRLLAPWHWPAWLVVGFVWLLVQLPYRVQMRLGRALGRLVYRISPRTRHIVRVNIRLCMPELDAKAQEALARKHGESIGCALFETGFAWWASDARVLPLLHLEGEEHLRACLAEGHGAILLSAHFTPLEIGVRPLVRDFRPAIMYQNPKNPVIAEVTRRARAHHTAAAIPSTQARALIGALKRNIPAWYAPDQREHGEDAPLVPFFGIPVTTNIATSRLARISRTKVLPYFTERRADGRGYLSRIGPPLENFPSDDPLADMARFHALIEAQVRRCPDQYLWSYKRFKRPGPNGDPYR